MTVVRARRHVWEREKNKQGPPLGIRGPGRRVSLPVSFSHQHVGSSILASLSEAGGLTSSMNREQAPSPSLAIPVAHLLKRAHVRH